MRKNNHRNIGLTMGVLLGLSACGGGSDSAPEQQAPVNAASTASSQSKTSESHAVGSTADSMAALAGSLTAKPIVVSIAVNSGGTNATATLPCTESLYADFVDTISWTVRHLQPKDCANLNTSTPAFAWPQPGDRATSKPWTFTLRRASGEIVEIAVTTVPRYFVSKALPAGDYLWHVSYASETLDAVGGNVIRASSPRRFTVTADGEAYALPSGATLAQTAMARPHPRVKPDGASFTGLANIAQNGEYKAAYIGLLAEANAARDAAVPSEPDMSVTSAWPTVNAGEAIEKLALASAMTGDQSYGQKAIVRLMSMAAWSPTGSTSELHQDQANRQIIRTLAQGYDFFHTQLSAEQIQLLARVLNARIAQAQGSLSSMDTWPFHPHAITANSYILEALLLCAGMPGLDNAEQQLAAAWETYLATLGAFQQDDGSNGMGVSYAWYGVEGLARTLAAVRVVAGADLSKLPAIAKFGDYLIAMTAPNMRLMNAFGDDAELMRDYFNFTWAAFRLYAKLTRNPNHEWYWRVDARNLTWKVYPGIWNFMVLGFNEPAVSPVAPSTASAVFPDAGIVTMHTSMAEPTRSSVFFRSSKFGSFNHMHADQNAFTMVSKGVNMLISGGYYDAYMSRHHAMVTRATRYKNALTFDGGIGQAEQVTSAKPVVTAPGQPYMSMDTRGRLLSFSDDQTWVFASGDAALAYRSYNTQTGALTPLLNDAIRTVAYNRKERVAVIYDYATSVVPRTWELNFNALAPFEAANTSARLVNGPASVCIDIYGLPGAFSTTSGFIVPPEKGTDSAGDVLVQQYQTRFVAATASTTLDSVTVVREDCRAVPIQVELNGSSAKVTVNDSASKLKFNRSAVRKALE